MKKLLIAVMVALFLITLCCGHRTVPHSLGSIYPATTWVILVDDDLNEIRVMDNYGAVFGFVDEDFKWSIGDICSLILTDMRTPDDTSDDRILKARYGGHLGKLFQE